MVETFVTKKFWLKDTKNIVYYCEENGYKEIENLAQVEMKYEHENGTKVEVFIGDHDEVYLDFISEDKDYRRNVYAVRAGSLIAARDMLEFLEYKKVSEKLVRGHVLYKNRDNDVKISGDVYFEGEKEICVKIEGEEDEVKKVCKEVLKVCKEDIIKEY